MCKTYYTINAREDIATDISLNRDLSRCDKFVPMRDHTSPLALISGMVSKTSNKQWKVTDFVTAFTQATFAVHLDFQMKNVLVHRKSFV